MCGKYIYTQIDIDELKIRLAEKDAGEKRLKSVMLNPVEVSEKMYNAGLNYISKKGSSWSVKDLYIIMSKAREL